MFASATRILSAILLAATAHAAGAGAAQSSSPWPSGQWRGTLDLGERQLEIIYHLEATADGFSGAMDVPGQGAMGLPLPAVSVDGPRLTIEMPLGGNARFEGSRSGEAIAGTFTQAGQSFPLNLEPVDDVLPPARPQEPEDPVPYRVDEVFFDGAGATRLAGTLTRPDSAGPFPGIVLVAGAGPHDRDGTFMNHRPLLVLADHLTRAGYAVLRYDERGVGRSAGEFASATGEHLAADIALAVETLRRHASVDRQRVGIIAHSEGGRQSALALQRSAEIDFLVLLGAPARPGIEGLRAQAEQSPNPVVALQAAMAEALIGLDAGADAEIALRRAAEERLAGLEAEQLAAFGGREQAVVDQLVQALAQPQALFSLAFDPRPALRRANLPVLALYGDRDRQMDAAGAALDLREVLGEYGEVQILDGLNHFFQQAETGAPGEYAMIEQTLAPAALQRIVSWLEAAP